MHKPGFARRRNPTATSAGTTAATVTAASGAATAAARGVDLAGDLGRRRVAGNDLLDFLDRAPARLIRACAGRGRSAHRNIGDVSRLGVHAGIARPDRTDHGHARAKIRIDLRVGRQNAEHRPGEHPSRQQGPAPLQSVHRSVSERHPPLIHVRAAILAQQTRSLCWPASSRRHRRERLYRRRSPAADKARPASVHRPRSPCWSPETV